GPGAGRAGRSRGGSAGAPAPTVWQTIASPACARRIVRSIAGGRGLILTGFARRVDGGRKLILRRFARAIAGGGRLILARFEPNCTAAGLVKPVRSPFRTATMIC